MKEMVLSINSFADVDNVKMERFVESMKDIEAKYDKILRGLKSDKRFGFITLKAILEELFWIGKLKERDLEPKIENPPLYLLKMKSSFKANFKTLIFLKKALDDYNVDKIPLDDLKSIHNKLESLYDRGINDRGLESKTIHLINEIRKYTRFTENLIKNEVLKNDGID
jgi:hypothetical protein